MKIAICFDHLCIFIWWVFLWPIWMLRCLTPNPSIAVVTKPCLFIVRINDIYFIFTIHVISLLYNSLQTSKLETAYCTTCHLPLSSVHLRRILSLHLQFRFAKCGPRSGHIDTHLALYPVAWFARCFLVEINGMVQGGVSWQAAYADQVRGN